MRAPILCTIAFYQSCSYEKIGVAAIVRILFIHIHLAALGELHRVPSGIQCLIFCGKKHEVVFYHFIEVHANSRLVQFFHLALPHC